MSTLNHLLARRERICQLYTHPPSHRFGSDLPPPTAIYSYLHLSTPKTCTRGHSLVVCFHILLHLSTSFHLFFLRSQSSQFPTADPAKHAAPVGGINRSRFDRKERDPNWRSFWSAPVIFWRFCFVGTQPSTSSTGNSLAPTPAAVEGINFFSSAAVAAALPRDAFDRAQLGPRRCF